MRYETIQVERGGYSLLAPYNLIRDEWVLIYVIEPFDKLGYAKAIRMVLQGKPKLEDIKSYILAWHDEQIDHKRQYGFSWKGISVELTAENKANYKDAYDFAKDDHAEGTYKTTTLKFGSMLVPEFYAFETFEELKEFSVSAKTYIERVYAVGWARKGRIDWTPYEEALQAYR